MLRVSKRFFFLFFIVLSGALLSFGFAREFYLLERASEQQKFRVFCDGQVRDIEKAIADAMSALENAGTFFDTRGTVERAEFNIFVQRLLKELPYVEALEWAPRVMLDQKSSWEESAAKEGLGPFRFMEKQIDGPLVPVRDRSEYFPIYYMEPAAGREPFLGLDVASDKDGLEALDKARLSGSIVVAPLTKLGQDKPVFGEFFLFRPLYETRSPMDDKTRRGSFKGVLLAVVSGPKLVKKTLKPQNLASMHIAIWDNTVPSRPQPLFYQGIGGEEWKTIDERSSGGRSDELLYLGSINVGERRWEVAILPRDPRGVLGYPWPIIVFFGGLLVTVIGLYVFIINKEFEKELLNQKTAMDRHAIVSKTDLQGRITYVNDKFCELSQYARSELVGETYDLLNSGYHTEAFFQDMWATIRKGTIWAGQVRNRAKDGSFFWVEMTIVPFFDARGLPKEHISICTDITRNIENEKRIEAAMQMKSDFIATVSHELRTPLASIKAALDVVLSGTAGVITEAQNKFLGKAKANIDRLKRLIDDFLDLSKLESGIVELNKSPTDMVALMNNVVEIQKAVAEKKGLGLRIQLDGELPLLTCDADKVSEVFINFVNNALKFTEKGEVVVEAALVTQEKCVRCAVRDTGEGIAEEDIPKLFGKFQQLGDPARRKTGGTGLGLAICKEIVTRHGGKIWVESSKGKGSSFIFTLPVQG